MSQLYNDTDAWEGKNNKAARDVYHSSPVPFVLLCLNPWPALLHVQCDRVGQLRAVPAPFVCHETNPFASGCKDVFLPAQDAGSPTSIYDQNGKTFMLMIWYALGTFLT